MEEKAISRTITKPATSVHEIEQTSSELHKVGMYTTAAFAAIVGIWGLVCLSSAFMSAGGPVSLIRSFISTTFGTM
ncbi:MAG: hypothetical protein JRC87_04780 [Deltaproteobacteria bacterium]|nr:hypothetical protein [Deltaproteobacteria bacterium]MBW2658903.1 hypothetical protein [Deltaproteobacteria bacterium]